MAKRFTETEKWKDPWFSELTNDYKLIYYYLLDSCDHAGIFQLNLRRLNFDCNTSITLPELLETLKGRVVQLSDDKLIITKFMYFQYGTKFWTSNQNPVVSALKILQSNNLLGVDDKGLPTLIIPYTNPTPTLNEPYTNPMVRVMDLDLDTDLSMEVEVDMDSDMNPNPIVDLEMNWEEEFNKQFNKL